MPEASSGHQCYRSPGDTLLSTYHDSLLPSLLHGRQTVSPSPPAGAACAAAYQLPSEPGKPVEEWSVADVQVWNGGGGFSPKVSERRKRVSTYTVLP